MGESRKECHLEVTVLVSHLGTFTDSYCGWYRFIAIHHTDEGMSVSALMSNDL